MVCISGHGELPGEIFGQTVILNFKMGLFSYIFYLGGFLFVLVWVTFTFQNQTQKCLRMRIFNNKKTVKMTRHEINGHGPQFWG